MARDYHILYCGELSDMPGRQESWTEFVRYLGRNQWEVLVEGTDFSELCASSCAKRVIRYSVDPYALSVTRRA